MIMMSLSMSSPISLMVSLSPDIVTVTVPALKTDELQEKTITRAAIVMINRLRMICIIALLGYTHASGNPSGASCATITVNTS